ncbi:MAG: hypothetical protein EA401_06040 [Planctomycetota bacterium]|nr:MAG: hypothetical protein EA401_06040 [Planctomycetota bacterium]
MLGSTTANMVHSGILWQDHQHAELLRCMRRLQRGIMEQSLDHQGLLEIKEFLQWYVRMHFDGEEAYMEHYHYPQAEQHCQQHAALRQQLHDTFTVLEDELGNPDLHACADLCVRLNQWYLTHIAGPDQELAAFLRDQGVR